MTSLSTILSRYPNIPADLRAQLSAELAGMERDAGRYQLLRSDPNSNLCVRMARGKEFIYVDGFILDTHVDAAMTKGEVR